MRRRRGVALILVLWILVLLGGIAASVLAGARTSSSLAANARARVLARYAAESGVEATRAAIEAALAAALDTSSLGAYLNSLEGERPQPERLGDQVFQVAVIDPGARLDVNAAPARNLALLLGGFTDIGRAEASARAIRAHIERDDGPPGSPASPTVTPVRSLEELALLPGVDGQALRRAAPFLTVDGDGTINGATAPAPVRAAAFGEMRHTPSRLTIIARGWRDAHPLTHEIQAVFAISNGRLVLVTWRERVL